MSKRKPNDPQLDKFIEKSALDRLLHTFRTQAQSEREKGGYFEELQQRVITVSLETIAIVKGLPELEV